MGLLISRSTLKLGLAIVAATATTSAAGAATAQAAVVDDDGVQLTSSGYDFGSSGFLAGGPTGSGDLDWIYSDGKISAHLTGTLHLNGVVGDCARMRLDYLDEDGDTLTTKYGGTVCAPDNGHHDWTVDLNPYSSAYVDEVKVSVEKQTVVNASFSTADYGYYRPDIVADDVKITTSGFDLGDEFWGVGSPIGDAHMLWPLSNGQLTPLLSGTLHLNNVNGGCARMNLRYLTESGTFLTSRAGGLVCSHDNGHHEFTVSLDPYTSNKIGKVKVQLQTQNANGTFNVVGSQTVAVAM